MVRTKENLHDFKNFQENIPVSEFLLKSSVPMEDLKQRKLITIDAHHRIILTDRGKVARKMGLKKFVEIEDFEKELTEENSQHLLQENIYLTGIICFLNIILMVVLVYINRIASMI